MNYRTQIWACLATLFSGCATVGSTTVTGLRIEGPGAEDGGPWRDLGLDQGSAVLGRELAWRGGAELELGGARWWHALPGAARFAEVVSLDADRLARDKVELSAWFGRRGYPDATVKAHSDRWLGGEVVTMVVDIGAPSVLRVVRVRDAAGRPLGLSDHALAALPRPGSIASAATLDRAHRVVQDDLWDQGHALALVQSTMSRTALDVRVLAGAKGVATQIEAPGLSRRSIDRLRRSLADGQDLGGLRDQVRRLARRPGLSAVDLSAIATGRARADGTVELALQATPTVASHSDLEPVVELTSPGTLAGFGVGAHYKERFARPGVAALELYGVVGYRSFVEYTPRVYVSPGNHGPDARARAEVRLGGVDAVLWPVVRLGGGVLTEPDRHGVFGDAAAGVVWQPSDAWQVHALVRGRAWRDFAFPGQAAFDLWYGPDAAGGLPYYFARGGRAMSVEVDLDVRTMPDGPRPTHGHSLNLKVEPIGALSLRDPNLPSRRFSRAHMTWLAAVPLWQDRWYGLLRAEAGALGPGVDDGGVAPSGMRFFLGGESLRGFGWNALAPDSNATVDERDGRLRPGGNVMMLAGGESRVRVVRGVDGVLLAEVGGLWDRWRDQGRVLGVSPGGLVPVLGGGVALQTPLGRVDLLLAAPLNRPGFAGHLFLVN